ncbi:hypothetical protein Taro_013312 [Colocasia esculenta]|uniref:Uncharacterized protein n=1 Tax=Colocasia esculenta TaxID=4460 RepID=A0A843U683_COLES|nr:hypothetical protein [Colocasia esculenta]
MKLGAMELVQAEVAIQSTAEVAILVSRMMTLHTSTRMDWSDERPGCKYGNRRYRLHALQ